MRWADRAPGAATAAVFAVLSGAMPAGAVLVVAAAPARAQQPIVPGPIMVSGGSAGAAGVGGQSTVLVTITNKGTLEDHLVRAVCADAGAAALQPPPGTSSDQASQGVPIPPGKAVAMAPAGWHLVMSQLHRPLTPGEVTACTIRFARSGEQLVELTVRAAGQ